MLGASMFHGLEIRTEIPRSAHLRVTAWSEGSMAVLDNFYTAFAVGTGRISSFNVTLIKLFVVGFFVYANLIKWLIFGKLTNAEKRTVRDNLGYTVWEFCFGFMVFINQITRVESITSYGEVIRTQLVQYSGLFLCVMLLKGFHSLSSERAYSIAYSQAKKSDYTKLAWGIAIINLVDVVLIHRFFYMTYYNNWGLKFENNILVAIFGFEILHMYPLILFTGVKYALVYYEKFHHVHGSREEEDVCNDKRAKFLNVIEFCVNFIRLGMACTFAVIFLYFYTFPIHILPSSYLTLRLLIVRARCLISIKKRNIRLNKIDNRMRELVDSKCIICFDDLNHSSTDGVCCLENCDHKYHYTCLKSWLSQSNSCPICRTKA